MLCSLSQPHSQCVGEGFLAVGDGFFPARRQEKVAADSDRARCGNRNEIRPPFVFFCFFFNLKTSEAASDVGPRAESIAGSVHRRDGAHAEFLRWWHFQKRCRAAAVRPVASPPPHRRV